MIVRMCMSFLNFFGMKKEKNDTYNSIKSIRIRILLFVPKKDRCQVMCSEMTKAIK